HANDERNRIADGKSPEARQQQANDLAGHHERPERLTDAAKGRKSDGRHNAETNGELPKDQQRGDQHKAAEPGAEEPHGAPLSPARALSSSACGNTYE